MSENMDKKVLNLDDLDKVAGGAYFPTDIKCPRCGSTNVEDLHQAHMILCHDCGCEF